jgi:urease accessory protein
LVWAAPFPLQTDLINTLLEAVRQDRNELEGTMHCGVLPQGLIARYSGDSSRDARFWFSRIWARTRQARDLAPPQIPRVWPLTRRSIGGLSVQFEHSSWPREIETRKSARSPCTSVPRKKTSC